MEKQYKRNCPKCNIEIRYSCYRYLWQSKKRNSCCKSCSILNSKEQISKSVKLLWKDNEYKNNMINSHLGISPPNKGKKLSLQLKQKLSLAHIKRYSDDNEKKKQSDRIKNAWKDPIKRARMLDRIKWKNVSCDKGQLEFLQKWNRLGFNFEPNYRISNTTDLFYLDGYDKNKNIVIEYDTQYHFQPTRNNKDIIRQNKIIHMINPKKFWRYNAVNKTIKNVLEKI